MSAAREEDEDKGDDGDAAAEEEEDTSMPAYFQSTLINDDAQLMVTMLKRAPRLLTSVDETGRGALWLATYHRSVACLAKLLQQPRIDVDAADGDGTTAMHVALWKHGDLRVVNALRAAGADLTRAPHAGGLKGRTPLQVAKLYKRSATLIALLESSVGESASQTDAATAGAGLDELRTRRAVPTLTGRAVAWWR